MNGLAKLYIIIAVFVVLLGFVSWTANILINLELWSFGPVFLALAMWCEIHDTPRRL